MSKYTGTKTEANLQAAFAGESQARNKYTYFASVARKEGFEQIAAIFQATADNEKEHAKLWFKELEGIGDTAANLEAAAAGEISSGRICTRHLPRPPRRRASPRLPSGSAWSPPSKSGMRSVTAPCCTTSRPLLFLRESEVKVWECRNCGHIVVGTESAGGMSRVRPSAVLL